MNTIPSVYYFKQVTKSRSAVCSEETSKISLPTQLPSVLGEFLPTEDEFLPSVPQPAGLY